MLWSDSKLSVQAIELFFIIVGAGIAKCALASRLSQEKQWKILLIEAGREETPMNDVPGAVAEIQVKVMGGTSVGNWMMYTRGNIADYNRFFQNDN